MMEPRDPGSGQRPLSWGERESRRRARQRAHRSAPAERAIGRLRSRLRKLSRALGLSRRRIVVAGVIYREHNAMSLNRAIGPTGPGVKEYAVQFPIPSGDLPGAQHAHRESMDIRFTQRRRYADLGHDPRVRFVRSLNGIVRPGDRVLDLGCGTGAGSAQLAQWVGPSGGVIAINRDGESIRYARQRYRANHLAFELGWIDTLSGELDQAFKCAVVFDLFRDASDDPTRSRAITEIWRVLDDGGTVLLASPHESDLNAYQRRLEGLGAERITCLDPDPVLKWVGIMGSKPENTRDGRVSSTSDDADT